MADDRTAWHTLCIQETANRLNVVTEHGLAPAVAAQRQARYGLNRLGQERRVPLWTALLAELREPMVLLLLVTGVLYALWGEPRDALTIFAVIAVVAGVELYNERRARRAIAGLARLAAPNVHVRRGGTIVEVPVEQLVPGDVVLLAAGQRVPADARLIETFGLAAGESALTGESAPVEKEGGPALSVLTPLAERSNLVYAGTTITYGRGSALVVATGSATELGRIAALAQTVQPPRTPLQVAMSRLSKGLVGLALGFSIVVPALGILVAGQPPQVMLLTGLSLAFATIPEELPVIITMVLALGGYRLARQRAIVVRLRAVETLGNITVIATDKTGTLTENRVRVSELWPPELRDRLLELGALCNDARDGDDPGGDPLDHALLEAARRGNLDPEGLRRAYPLLDLYAFNNTRRMMMVLRQAGAGLRVAAKGAPEAIVARCCRHCAAADANRAGDFQWASDETTGDAEWSEAGRNAVLMEAERMAAGGLRVIALAEKRLFRAPANSAEAEEDLTFVGLAGFADPPRPEVPDAIAACREAGIRPLMITGDHLLTAEAVAEQVGLVAAGQAAGVTGPQLDLLSDVELAQVVREHSVFARTTPQHKLRIVQALQAAGERVAVTGDGTNDAPALAAADIGVAMGETGTDVAREAADIVLADDNFATIVAAVREGRALYANLQGAVRYYLACKVALIGASLLPVLLLLPVPFAPVQIILMELFMDVAAAAAFVAEPPDTGLMRARPRDPRRRFMDGGMVLSILVTGAGLFAAVTAVYLFSVARDGDGPRAQSLAFYTWLIGHVLLALNMRSLRRPLLSLGLFSNRLMVAWAVAALAFVTLTSAMPALQPAFRTIMPSPTEWLAIVGAAVVGTFWLEVVKLWRRR